MIIDCHTHWGICWKEKYKIDSAEFIKVLDKYAIDKCLLMGHESLCRIDKCKEGNNDVLRLASANPNKIIPVFTIWPQNVKEAATEIERCVNKGIRIIKVHPWLQGFSVSTKEFGEICEIAGQHQVPIIFHDGTPCFSLSEQIGGLARRFPKTTFVMGHSGLLWNWESAIEAMKHCNIWATMCGVHLRAIELFCQKTDTERLLWGSDFGFSFADSIDYRLGLIHQAKINSKYKEKILGENAVKLFKL